MGPQLNGSTGLAVAAVLNNTVWVEAFIQTFTAIDLFGYAGNEDFQLIPTLTLPTTVVVGNGNNSRTLAGGNDTVTMGSGSNNVVGGNGNTTITAKDAAGASDVILLGNGNDSATRLCAATTT